MPDFSWEDLLVREGFAVVAGIDEAGRGPLAGPVVAGAVVLPRPFDCPGLDDSKKLSGNRRAEIYEQLTTDPAVLWAAAQASVQEIEELNIHGATQLAMQRALLALPVAPHAALVDGRPLKVFPVHHRGIIDGDQLCCSIAAASVIAKVTRDRLMMDYALAYPHYGFEKHKGYGTKYHLAQMELHGPCPIHRQSFRPVAEHARRVASLSPAR